MRFPSKISRLTGIAIPVGSIRTATSEGVGDFLDLIPFGDFARRSGVRLIQLLPVNDTGFQSSPYSALSAFALHPIYVKLSALPEASGFETDVASLRKELDASPRIEYEKVLRKKLAILRAMYERNSEAIAKDGEIDSWEKKNQWIAAYAAYSLLKERNDGKPWHLWTDASEPTPSTLKRLKVEAGNELRFFSWLQMRLEGQFIAASKALSESGILLKGDIPILMNDDSADVWALRRNFRRDFLAGAPPDMFSTLGQNWGFPTYDWDALKADDYAFWKKRLKQASKFYHAFRIDHVLGFFRIWTISGRNETGYLGRFLPGATLSREDLARAGFDDGRLRWLSEPHVRLETMKNALPGNQDSAVVASRALERIGNEDLFLFRREIAGERDIDALGLPPSLASCLKEAYRDRVLMPVGNGSFVPTWSYWETQAFPTLGDSERGALESLIRRAADESERTWRETGRELLGMAREATDMLPCAEDLGAVPACVPEILEELGILGLRICRWTRDWNAQGQPFIPPSRYPENTVTMPGCHDTSTLRVWWEREEGREAFWRALGLGGTAPADYDPATAAKVLAAIAETRSRFLILQLQDLLDLSDSRRSRDPSVDRVNVPGTCNAVNWTWRAGHTCEDLASDDALAREIGRIAEIHDGKPGQGGKK